jgi:hypothetical protein
LEETAFGREGAGKRLEEGLESLLKLKLGRINTHLIPRSVLLLAEAAGVVFGALNEPTIL